VSKTSKEKEKAVATAAAEPAEENLAASGRRTYHPLLLAAPYRPLFRGGEVCNLLFFSCDNLYYHLHFCYSDNSAYISLLSSGDDASSFRARRSRNRTFRSARVSGSCGFSRELSLSIWPVAARNLGGRAIDAL